MNRYPRLLKLCGIIALLVTVGISLPLFILYGIPGLDGDPTVIRARIVVMYLQDIGIRVLQRLQFNNYLDYYIPDTVMVENKQGEYYQYVLFGTITALDPVKGKIVLRSKLGQSYPLRVQKGTREKEVAYRFSVVFKKGGFKRDEYTVGSDGTRGVVALAGFLCTGEIIGASWADKRNLLFWTTPDGRLDMNKLYFLPPVSLDKVEGNYFSETESRLGSNPSCIQSL